MEIHRDITGLDGGVTVMSHRLLVPQEASACNYNESNYKYLQQQAGQSAATFRGVAGEEEYRWMQTTENCKLKTFL